MEATFKLPNQDPSITMRGTNAWEIVTLLREMKNWHLKSLKVSVV